MIKNIAAPRLRRLTIKPLLACTGNCPHCKRRQDLHKDLRLRRQLSLEDWKRLLAEARGLGTVFLDISGGEPTLYKQLPELIRVGRTHRFMVNLNSNGSLIDDGYAQELLRAGLNSITISLYSHQPDEHDSMKMSKGMWQKAVSAIEAFGRLGRRYPAFKVKTQTILCRENYKSFAGSMELYYRLGAYAVAMNYLEGDFAREFLLNEGEIRHFRKEVIPRVVSCCKKSALRVRNKAIRMVRSIFAENILSDADWAEGAYRPKNKNFPPCPVPRHYAMILANGDVHPCEIVEYTHAPVAGNVFNNSLREIWQGERFADFRKAPPAECRFCPVNLHLYIPLKPTGLIYGWNVVRRMLSSS